MIPVAGSAYTYGYATLGEIFAWIIGWDLVLEYAFGAATVCSGWSGYVLSPRAGLRPPPPARPRRRARLDLRHWQRPLGAPRHASPTSSPWRTSTQPRCRSSTASSTWWPSSASCSRTTVLIIGIKESANFNSFIVVVKVAVLLVFLGVGGIHPAAPSRTAAVNWHPFLPPNPGTSATSAGRASRRGAAVIFFAYIGFDAVSTAAQEAKNPKRDMPIGILGSLAICTVLYILVGARAHRPGQLQVPRRAGLARRRHRRDRLQVGQLLVKIGALGGLTSTMIVMLLGQSRVFFSMSKDGLLPKMFSAVHPKFRTPWISSLTVGLVVATFASLIPLASLGEMTSIGTLLAFIIVCAGVGCCASAARSCRGPSALPGCRSPRSWASSSPCYDGSLPAITWIRLVVWLAVGLVIYFFYGRHHSRVQKGLPRYRPE